MPNCNVFSCKKRSETSSLQKDNITFHLFPKDAMIRDVWIRACGNHVSWTPKRTSTICSQHFETTCFIIQSNNKRRLKQAALPTLKLPQVEESVTSTPKRRKVETFEDSLPSKTQESKSTIDQPDTSQSGNQNPQFNGTPKIKKLKNLLQMKNKQLKRLQSQKRFLMKKVVELREIINDLSEKSSIDKKNRQVLDRIGVEEKELVILF